MDSIKKSHGGKRPGAGRKPALEEKIILKVPVYKSVVNAKGGEQKAINIMFQALIIAPNDDNLNSNS
jgi:hypothetical protein